jgi:hypothetical protein
MTTKSIPKMIPRMIYLEPELWQQLKRFSHLFGCDKHPDIGSGSEAARKFIKTGILLKNPGCKNIQGINWNEIYN